MNMMRTFGIIFIVAGALGLTYNGFTYTKNTEEIKVGPLEMSVQERERVDIPVWAGAGALAFGVVLILIGNRRI